MVHMILFFHRGVLLLIVFVKVIPISVVYTLILTVIYFCSYGIIRLLDVSGVHVFITTCVWSTGEMLRNVINWILTRWLILICYILFFLNLHFLNPICRMMFTRWHQSTYSTSSLKMSQILFKTIASLMNLIQFLLFNFPCQF